MIGALLLKHGVNTGMTAKIESRDAARLTAAFSEDVVITSPSKDPVVGREAAEGRYREDFDEIVDEKITVQGVALAHPYAFGLSNTALCEVEATVTYKDGRTVTGCEVYAIDFEGKGTKAMRYYVGDLALIDQGVSDGSSEPEQDDGAEDDAPRPVRRLGSRPPGCRWPRASADRARSQFPTATSRHGSGSTAAQGPRGQTRDSSVHQRDMRTLGQG
jgi:ketosteroid isomerase-like protein